MQKTIHILLFSYILLSVSACGVFHATTQTVPKQGISGYVYEQMGNAMPLRDKPVSKGRPIQTVIYVYSPLKMGDTLGLVGQMAAKINGQLVDSCKSDATGHYSIALQPGVYSILVPYDHGYFIPFYSGREGLANTEVKPNSFTALDIIVNAKASY